MIMKRRLLMICLATGVFFTTYAQEKVFEAKVNTGTTIGFGGNEQLSVFAGAKNFNVIQLSDGKIVLDKSFKDAGSAVAKGLDAYVSGPADKFVVCDEKTVSCIDTKSGSKVWESKSFNELASGSGSLMIADNFVLVSDKKAKDNFSLTCLSLADGKTIWSLSDEKSKIFIDNIFFIPSYNSLGIYTSRKGEKNTLRLVNLETGKVDASVELEGSPVTSLSNENNGTLYVHNRVSEESSFLTAVSLKDRKMLWKTKSANKSPQTPMTMNTSVYTYYARIQVCDDKVLLVTEGIEAFNASTGKQIYNIAYVPYYKWGVGHYTNGIFYPVVTSSGLLIADRTKGDLYIKMMDKNTGSQIWSTEKLKGMDCAPVAIVSENSAAIQFGGLNYFEVMNNTGIGKLLKPFVISSFDLKTGKQVWTMESKKDFYYISPSNSNIMVVGTKEFQTLDANSGSIVSTDKNPFKEDYFMTKFAINSTHKIQKDVDFDFSTRRAVLFEDGKLSVYKF
jgi:outer membrane protein assembly factor BamB